MISSLAPFIGAGVVAADTISPVESFKRLECSSTAISHLLPSGATLTHAIPIPANGSFGDGNLEFPQNATGLPASCVLTVNVVSSPSSSFNFGLLLPTENGAWNGRMMTAGNGGFGGGINWPDMGIFAHYGFAALATDTGHNSSVFDGAWALNRPESITDWGFRAMHGSVVLAKELVAALYGRPIAHSYYSGCSTGGRQGLKEVEMFPEDFDGAVIGAPAWWTTHLQPWTEEVGLKNLPVDSPGRISAQLFSVVEAEILRQCDPQDGVRDGIISDPDGCHFVPDTLLCARGATENCLTPPQLDTLYTLTHDWVDANQTFVFPGLALGADFTPLIAGTAPHPAGSSWLQNFLFNSSDGTLPPFDLSTVELADSVNPGRANADAFDLGAFRARGGKLIHYHGFADPLIPTGSSVYFRRQVQRAMALPPAQLDAFYRFFVVPGMGHCSGAPAAPWYFAQSAIAGTDHGVPGFEDAQHDVLLAIMDWVENGRAPEKIVATKFVGDDASKGVQSQRPLCPYPAQAKFNGRGKVDEASSWSCVGI